MSQIYGGEGNDMIEGGAAVGRQNNPGTGRIEGNNGNDDVIGFDYLKGIEYLYGDTSATADLTDFYGDDGSYLTSTGDDVIYGGSYVTGDVYIAGGGGNDIIIGGTGLLGASVSIYGDHIGGDYLTYSSEVDGDDLIRIGDSPMMDDGTGGQGTANVYGQGGNDKVIGGIG